VQLAGRPGADHQVLAVAELLQKAASSSMARSLTADPARLPYSIR
jgi:hypothetical protein